MILINFFKKILKNTISCNTSTDSKDNTNITTNENINIVEKTKSTSDNIHEVKEQTYIDIIIWFKDKVWEVAYNGWNFIKNLTNDYLLYFDKLVFEIIQYFKNMPDFMWIGDCMITKVIEVSPTVIEVAVKVSENPTVSVIPQVAEIALKCSENSTITPPPAVEGYYLFDRYANHGMYGNKYYQLFLHTIDGLIYLTGGCIAIVLKLQGNVEQAANVYWGSLSFYVASVCFYFKNGIGVAAFIVDRIVHAMNGDPYFRYQYVSSIGSYVRVDCLHVISDPVFYNTHENYKYRLAMNYIKSLLEYEGTKYQLREIALKVADRVAEREFIEAILQNPAARIQLELHLQARAGNPAAIWWLEYMEWLLDTIEL